MKMIELTMDEFQKAAREVEMALVPVGMVEAHGSHCPLGTDIFIPRHIIEAIEEKMGHRVLVTPEIPHGSSWDLAPFPGTIHLPVEVLEEYVFHVASELTRWGLDKIAFINGHGGNIPALIRVMQRLADDGHASVTINWWQDFRQEIMSVCSTQGHAGEDETSAVLAVREELVDMDLAKSNNAKADVLIRYPNIQLEALRHGLTGDATQASKAKGEQMLSLIIPRILDILDGFAAGTLLRKDSSND